VKHPHSEHLCPWFQTAMDVLSRPWNGLIMAMLQTKGVLRFSELRAGLTAMGDRMLSERLKELELRGLVSRRVEPGPPVRVVYELTEVGRGFRDVALALSGWGRHFKPAAARRARARKSRPAA
jgi:DNA-binding HxlR family transcriptional regulator